MNEKQIFLCGDSKSFGIYIKILGSKLYEFSDCTFTLYFEGTKYGVIDENLIASHDFLECNILRNDIEYTIRVLKNENDIINISDVHAKDSIQDTLSQVVRYNYCCQANNNILSILNNHTTVKFILNSHDSMKSFFLIPFYMYGKFYIAIASRYDEYINFECSKDYNWSFDTFVYYNINKKDFIETLKCVNTVLSNVVVPSKVSETKPRQ